MAADQAVRRDPGTSYMPHSDLVIYPDAGHGGKFHEQFVGEALTFLGS